LKYKTPTRKLGGVFSYNQLNSAVKTISSAQAV
jgi:hypothetical protein